MLAEICRALEMPVYAVLGNHDWHCNQRGELPPSSRTPACACSTAATRSRSVDGAAVGIVGLKGFVGGFPDSALPDFGEPMLRQVYAETTAEVDALDRGLAAIAGCDYPNRPAALRADR